MMRILVDCMPLNVGGGVQVAIAFILNLQNRTDIEWRAVLPVGLKTSLPPQILSDSNVIFVRKYSTIDRIWLSRKLAALEQAFNPDVVFSVFGPAFFRAHAPHLVGFALPHLIYSRDIYSFDGPLVSRNPLSYLFDWLRCASFRGADHLVVETNTVRQRLADHLKIDPAKISVIGNSLNPVLLQHGGAQPAPTDLFRILVPSAYYKHKNLEIIPAVAAAMHRLDRSLAFKFQLTLPESGAHWRSMKALLEKYGITDKVVTLGALPVHSLSQAYQAASAIFLPSLREASTAVYPESFFFRRPLVTSDIDFARELCGDSALYVPPLDAEKIAVRLVELAHRDDLRTRLTSAGEVQLASTYPRTDEKFRMQLELLDALSRDRYLSSRTISRSDTGPISMRRVQEEAQPSFHDVVAPDWDAKYQSGGFLRRANFFKREIMPHITRSGHWLDAGCGSGYFGRLLAAGGMQVTGVDASAPMIAAAKKLATKQNQSAPLRFEVVPGLAGLPFPDNTFAGCLCLSVLEYVDEPYAALDELARVIERDGFLVLSVPSRHSGVRLIQQIALCARFDRIVWRLRYKDISNYSTTQKELRAAFSRRGFQLMKIISFDPIIPSRLLTLLAPSLLFVIGVKSK